MRQIVFAATIAFGALIASGAKDLCIKSNGRSYKGLEISIADVKRLSGTTMAGQGGQQLEIKPLAGHIFAVVHVRVKKTDRGKALKVKKLELRDSEGHLYSPRVMKDIKIGEAEEEDHEFQFSVPKAAKLFSFSIDGFTFDLTEQLDWSDATQADTMDAYLGFVKKHPDSRFAIQALGKLRGHSTPHDRFVIVEFKEIIDSQPETAMTCTLKGVAGDPGKYEVTAEKMDIVVNPKAGGGFSTASALWNPGAQHTLLGYLRIGKYEIISNSEKPLVFRMIRGEGYVYQKGNGIIQLANGELVCLDAAD